METKYLFCSLYSIPCSVLESLGINTKIGWKPKNVARNSSHQNGSSYRQEVLSAPLGSMLFKVHINVISGKDSKNKGTYLNPSIKQIFHFNPLFTWKNKQTYFNRLRVIKDKRKLVHQISLWSQFTDFSRCHPEESKNITTQKQKHTWQM